MTIQEMKEKKREFGYSLKQISELSGVPLGTVQKIFNGETKSPRFETLEMLSAIFRSKGNDYDSGFSGVKEEPAIYNGKKQTFVDLEHFNGKVQGQYTIDDYRALPSDVRVELIDGHFFYMEAPNPRHQLFIGEIYAAIRQFIRDNNGKCITFLSPMDVQLDCDDKTMVQPDVFVVCDPRKLTEKNLYGNPDFVVEVLSPLTSKKDRYIKSKKYKDAGVSEYWMVDTKKKNVVVYLFDNEGNDDDIAIYGFDTPVPVGIYDGKLKVDFRDIDEFVDRVYGNV